MLQQENLKESIQQNFEIMKNFIIKSINNKEDFVIIENVKNPEYFQELGIKVATALFSALQSLHNISTFYYAMQKLDVSLSYIKNEMNGVFTEKHITAIYETCNILFEDEDLAKYLNIFFKSLHNKIQIELKEVETIFKKNERVYYLYHDNFTEIQKKIDLINNFDDLKSRNEDSQIKKKIIFLLNQITQCANINRFLSFIINENTFSLIKTQKYYNHEFIKSYDPKPILEKYEMARNQQNTQDK